MNNQSFVYIAHLLRICRVFGHKYEPTHACFLFPLFQYGGHFRVRLTSLVKIGCADIHKEILYFLLKREVSEEIM